MNGFTFAENTDTEKREKVLIANKQYETAHLKSYRVYNRKRDNVERICWLFEVVTKKGTFEVPGFTSTKFGIHEGKPATARKWAAALRGMDWKNEELPRDMDSLVGRPCQVITTTLGEGDDESSVVDQVLPVPDAEADDF